MAVQHTARDGDAGTTGFCCVETTVAIGNTGAFSYQR